MLHRDGEGWVCSGYSLVWYGYIRNERLRASLDAMSHAGKPPRPQQVSAGPAVVVTEFAPAAESERPSALPPLADQGDESSEKPAPPA